MYVCIYIYIYIVTDDERDEESERQIERLGGSDRQNGWAESDSERAQVRGGEARGTLREGERDQDPAAPSSQWGRR